MLPLNIYQFQTWIILQVKRYGNRKELDFLGYGGDKLIGYMEGIYSQISYIPWVYLFTWNNISLVFTENRVVLSVTIGLLFLLGVIGKLCSMIVDRPRWLCWMHIWLASTGDQEVAGLIPVESATFFHGDLIMKHFLRSFSPFRWFKKGSCQFLAKVCAQYWFTT